MRKLHLSLNALEVQSFETTPVPRRADGTVQAHETFESECVCDTDECGGGTTGYTCGGCDTPGYTCEENCTSVGPADPVEHVAGVVRGW